MPATVLYSKEQLESVKIKLNALDAKDKREFNAQEAISYLRGTIDEMRTKNFTEAEICSELNNSGIKITVSTLHTYLREKNTHYEKHKRARKKDNRSKHLEKPEIMETEVEDPQCAKNAGDISKTSPSEEGKHVDQPALPTASPSTFNLLDDTEEL